MLQKGKTIGGKTIKKASSKARFCCKREVAWQ
jgi:hypothetical protein